MGIYPFHLAFPLKKQLVHSTIYPHNLPTEMTTLLSPLQPKLPKPGGHLSWCNLEGTALSLTIANACKSHHGLLLIITPDMLTAEQLSDELAFFSGDTKKTGILTFPDRETLPYDPFAPHQDIISERLLTLSKLPLMAQGILIVPITTLLHRLPPKDYIAAHSLMLTLKQQLDLSLFRQMLEKSGYRYSTQVMGHGEFTVRGSIIDLFPMGSKRPYRIDLFDNEIDSIRTFDIENQRSLEKIEKISLLPAHEFPITEQSINLFRSKWRQFFSGNPMNSQLYQEVSEGHYIAGLEYYLPLFFNEIASLIDYLPENTLIIRYEGIQQEIQKFQTEIEERYEQLRHDITQPILTPIQLFLSQEELFASAKKFSQIRILHLDTSKEQTGLCHYAIKESENFSISHQTKYPFLQLENFIRNNKAPILFSAETLGRKETVLNLLQQLNINPAFVEDWSEFIRLQHPLAIAIAPLEKPLRCENPAFNIITEFQLFGARIQQRRKQKFSKIDHSDLIIRNLTELQIGDPIVHIDHGIGRYQGLQTITVGNQVDEYLVICYADDTKLYVPVSCLNVISRYSGSDPEHAPLHKLGSDQWDKIKQKAEKHIHDVAAELLEVYARRAARQGYAFTQPSQDYFTFSENFPFEETLDQTQAIHQVISDMCSDKPMDRLICGDVGFGKTEVAMRAAFLAVQSNKQVAIFVPTTLLAQQHYENFKDRFANWPITIEVISRFRSQKQQSQIIDSLKQGKIDIIIGTHKLLQKNIKFKNLGLLVVDEEHRFGVQQKEHLKKIRSEVDILTLTATPIPRTLNMSLSAMRDLSIIATPPKKRLSIKTFVQEKKKQTIREAILREILRGGQIYYLHNNVETIEKTAHDLQTLIPEARIKIAHGKMHEKELEQAMADFYHRRFHVLVCTTIIETGIDIPSANTIIIERADKFGLAQLHQLRGRVGRSHHQAYAYLIIPSKKTITKDALKRLEAIEMLEDLGAGFTLATHDMEIRGAGELLGEEQSGHIQEIGFSLYMELLNRAVKNLKAGKTLSLKESLAQNVTINLQINALIPEDYLPDVHMRLVLYKRIANAETFEDLNNLQAEMIDRFGLLPQSTKNLFEITALKLKAQPLGIKNIDGNDQNIKFEFTEKPHIDPRQIIHLIQKYPDRYKLIEGSKLKWILNASESKSRIQAVQQFLEQTLSQNL